MPSSAATLRRITVLSGGVGGARFLQGLLHGLRTGVVPGGSADTEVTVVANTADDWWIHGLKVCPDLDTVMYTLGDGIDLERGWGRREETWSAKGELEAYGVEPTWFGLGDRDIATHLVRTQMLEAGYTLSQVTEALCRRWLSDVHGGRLRLVPMSDDRVETHVAVADPDSPSGRSVIHFQEYWVRLRASVPAEAVLVVGQDTASPAPGVLDAITGADLVV
ncbi:MAG TPA: 2-phospho-L-lactate transferase CofD family protein, partial [Nocardioides sp.]